MCVESSDAGHERKSGANNVLSAFLPKADIQALSPHVGKVPEEDVPH